MGCSVEVAGQQARCQRLQQEHSCEEDQTGNELHGTHGSACASWIEVCAAWWAELLQLFGLQFAKNTMWGFAMAYLRGHNLRPTRDLLRDLVSSVFLDNPLFLRQPLHLVSDDIRHQCSHGLHRPARVKEGCSAILFRKLLRDMQVPGWWGLGRSYGLRNRLGHGQSWSE